MKSPSLFSSHEERDAYWRRVVRLTGWLLAIWFVATIAIIFFARELSTIVFFGWPLSFYLTAQGIVLVYLAIIAFYAWSMRQLDKAVRQRAEERRLSSNHTHE